MKKAAHILPECVHIFLLSLFLSANASATARMPAKITMSPEFFFLHFPKSGGTSIGLLLEQMTQPCNRIDGCVTSPNFHLSYKAKKTCVVAGCEGLRKGELANYFQLLDHAGFYKRPKLLLMLRNPRDHCMSMWAHCQQSGAYGNRVHHYARIDFASWLELYAYDDGKNGHKYCNYDPRDIMTRALTFSTGGMTEKQERPNITSALQILTSPETTAWVGILEYLSESICSLSKVLKPSSFQTDRIWDTLNIYCDCNNDQTLTLTKSAPRFRLPNMPHRFYGTNTSDIVFTKRMSEAMDIVSRSDWMLYGAALNRFEQDIEHTGLNCLLPALNV